MPSSLNEFWLKYSDVKHLLDVTSNTVGHMITGKPEEISRQLISENDITEVEKS